ncbi:hypothetical protein GCM10023149_11380 [Mucilaginibacter gynuensis]|uniref:DUF5655 domain-containing protein n=1 Tax=Mucilaginibacter gynuensis TaxID=1302236 RepID=A0ABP8G0S1_9SPHI
MTIVLAYYLNSLSLNAPITYKMNTDEQLNAFLQGKSEHTLMLFDHFITSYKDLGDVGIYPTKSMIGITAPDERRIAWVTQLGKSFIHVVFPFKQPYDDSTCFQKIAQVPGDDQYNHHFRMLQVDDINDEVIGFMKLALQQE